MKQPRKLRAARPSSPSPKKHSCLADRPGPGALYRLSKSRLTEIPQDRYPYAGRKAHLNPGWLLCAVSKQMPLPGCSRVAVSFRHFSPVCQVVVDLDPVAIDVAVTVPQGRAAAGFVKLPVMG
jgi:hypothetical protein